MGSLQRQGLRTQLQILEFKGEKAIILIIQYFLQGFVLSSLKHLLEQRLEEISNTAWGSKCCRIWHVLPVLMISSLFSRRYTFFLHKVLTTEIRFFYPLIPWPVVTQ